MVAPRRPQPPSKKATEMSSVIVASCLFITHTFLNSFFMSPLSWEVRCQFWNQPTCSKDEAWMANWFAFSLFHVALLLTALAYSSFGTPKMESALSYLVASIIFVYAAIGLVSVDLLNPLYIKVQLGVFGILLLAIGVWTADQEKKQPIITLQRSWSSSSLDQRSKLALSTLAVATQLVGSVVRVLEMVFGSASTGYLGDSSSPIYQSISTMSIGNMLVVVGILGVSLRFFEADHHKYVLRAHSLALVVSQFMLAGGQGDMIQVEDLQAGGIGTFVSILTSVLGSL